MPRWRASSNTPGAESRGGLELVLRGYRCFRGSLTGLFSFWDLLSLRVIGELVERGVPRNEIARGAEYLATELETHRPFTHERLATVGQGFFADVGSWVDVGMDGQQAFQIVIEPLLDS